MRLYRLLLRLYPASFRGDYGEEMAVVFRARLRDARGPFARLAVWFDVCPEIVMNGLAVHWDILKQDLRYTARTLRRAPGFALAAVVIVALGVGANTAAFTVTDFVLLRPLPFQDPDRLVTIWQKSPGYDIMELAPGNIRDWKRTATSFERVGIRRGLSVNLIGPGEPERVEGAAVDTDVFPTLGVRAALGRIFLDGEDSERAAPTVILSNGLWRTMFGGDPNVLGRTVTLDDTVHTIVGVMPPGFNYPGRDAEVWIPLVLPPDEWQDRGNNEFYAVARLKPGVTLEAARAEMDVLAAQSRRQFPKENETTGATVNRLHDELVFGEPRLLVLALTGAAFCVLLIVCANLGNLLLARALGRRQELAVRAAMGAGRDRLIRQLATESAVLAIAGGALGVLLAMAVVPLLWSLVPAELPTDAIPSVDGRVLAFASVLTLVTALIFGIAPVMRKGADTDLQGLREGPRAVGGRKDRLRGGLVVAEVIASVVLLVATGLLLRALLAIQGRDPGFRPEGVLTAKIDLPLANYFLTARRTDFYNRVLDQIRALPGVEGAAFISGLPMVWGGGIWPVGINGVELERREDNTATMRFVTPGFFATMGIAVREGRDVSESDTTNTQPVAVVSESFVRRYWPGRDGLGRQFNFAGQDRTIVGVVGTIRVRGLERESEPQVYLPHRQHADGRQLGYIPRELVVSATTAPADLASSIRTIIRAVDPQQPISAVRAMTEIIDGTTASRRVQIRVLAGFALVAFVLAAIGIHGVLSFAVSQRTPEIGVRIALGAQRADIVAMVMKRGMLLVVAGLMPGLALAYAAGRSLEMLLAGVTPADVPTFAAALGLTLVMAFGGMLLPTLRAISVDPIKAIRAQ
jgi:putative ABC transport system permease protein